MKKIDTMILLKNYVFYFNTKTLEKTILRIMQHLRLENSLF